MKKKANPNTTAAKNELLRFEKLLTKNLASNSGISMPNLHESSNRSNSVIFDEQPFSSTNLPVSGLKSKSSTVINHSNNLSTNLDNDYFIDTKQIKGNLSSFRLLGSNNLKLFTTYFTNLSKTKEISNTNVFVSISSYFSNWAELLRKFFIEFNIEFEIPKCPEYIEKLIILEDSVSDHITSDTNNIRNCLFSIYKWNYLFLKIMKYMEDRENQTEKVLENYESQSEHVQLLKEVVNQKYGKD